MQGGDSRNEEGRGKRKIKVCMNQNQRKAQRRNESGGIKTEKNDAAVPYRTQHRRLEPHQPCPICPAAHWEGANGSGAGTAVRSWGGGVGFEEGSRRGPWRESSKGRRERERSRIEQSTVDRASIEAGTLKEEIQRGTRSVGPFRSPPVTVPVSASGPSCSLKGSAGCTAGLDPARRPATLVADQVSSSSFPGPRGREAARQPFMRSPSCTAPPRGAVGESACAAERRFFSSFRTSTKIQTKSELGNCQATAKVQQRRAEVFEGWSFRRYNLRSSEDVPGSEVDKGDHEEFGGDGESGYDGAGGLVSCLTGGA
ncbi:hypothetical protein C8R45DRAFT_123286 [Mycena sanguinolenta]|nr:hypothetical protein C8R45DRAFT_123286 [Mycena sanguinolenta]